nr:uncharacterized protein LOC109405244 [Aedes albopictus]
MDSFSDHQSNYSNQSSSESSQELHSSGNWNTPNKSLSVEFQKQSTPFMVSVLDDMCHEPDFIEPLSEILSNPFTVCKILREEPSGQIKLTIYFQWLEKSRKNFVWTVVDNINHFVDNCSGLPDEHLLGFSSLLNFGSFLMESAWYAEAVILLNIAKAQSQGQPMMMLQVSKFMALALALSNRHEAAFITMSEVHTLLGLIEGIPKCLKVETHCSLAVSYFETCEFNASYQEGLLALQLLEDGICSIETIIGVFRQLSKSCLAKRKPFQAKLLITQAVSWAWHNFGILSRIFADTLEDYACYLLMLNAYEDAVKVTTDARNIFSLLYGSLALEPELAQGNLPFRLYLITDESWR